VSSKHPNLSASEDAPTIDVVFQPEASALMFKTYPFSFDINIWSSYILKKKKNNIFGEERKEPGMTDVG